MTDYAAPTNLAEAVEILGQRPGTILAGGTDLMIELRRTRLAGLAGPEFILDLANIQELHRLELAGEAPFIGAAISYRRLETDPAVADRYPLLARAAASVGSAQIRETGTLGGNVGSASPAGDGVCALTALGAIAEIASAQGLRRVPVTELILAPNRTKLATDEIIIGFYLDKLPPATAQVFTKVGRRQAVAVARLNLAVALNQDLTEVRIALGACFPSPRRLSHLEEMIASGKPGLKLWQAVGKAAGDEFVNVCGLRSSAGYKIPAISRVMAATLKKAWDLAEAKAAGGGS